MMIDEKIKLGAQLELARREFFFYTRLMAPDFYLPDRQYLKDLADEMQSFMNSDDDVLVLNAPPRHGKSLTGSMFVEWLLGRNNALKIMTGSYNDTLSTQFSKGVRNVIQEVKADDNILVYNDIFPKTHIKYGDASMNLWSLEGSHTNNYLATSPTGTATGFGADLIIIDDLIKSALEARNANTLNNQWTWFTDTMLSRLESGGKIIATMTRWSTKDLAGMILSEMPQMGYKVRHVNMKALQDDGTMLCADVLNRTDYDKKVAVMGADIASANYQQEPIDLKGSLYQKLKTYENRPEFDGIYAYCDTADQGSDWLVSIVYGVKDMQAYIIDVVMTQEPMEVTEQLVSMSYINNNVNEALIESNNGGRGFARQIESKLINEFGTNKTVISWFHNSSNKNARILSNSSWVEENIFFPADWRLRFPDFYKSITEYQRAGKNEHDDAEDALTGVAEVITGQRQKEYREDRQLIF